MDELQALTNAFGSAMAKTAYNNPGARRAKVVEVSTETGAYTIEFAGGGSAKGVQNAIGIKFAINEWVTAERTGETWQIAGVCDAHAATLELPEE